MSEKQVLSESKDEYQRKVERERTITDKVYCWTPSWLGFDKTMTLKAPALALKPTCASGNLKLVVCRAYFHDDVRRG